VVEEFNLPPAVATIVCVAYILICSEIVSVFSQWTYFDAFYFNFVSLSTIGFGDVAQAQSSSFIVFFISMLVGFALVAMVINVLTVALKKTIKKAKKATTRVLAAGQRLTVSDVCETRPQQ